MPSISGSATDKPMKVGCDDNEDAENVKNLEKKKNRQIFSAFFFICVLEKNELGTK